MFGQKHQIRITRHSCRVLLSSHKLWRCSYQTLSQVHVHYITSWITLSWVSVWRHQLYINEIAAHRLTQALTHAPVADVHARDARAPRRTVSCRWSHDVWNAPAARGNSGQRGSCSNTAPTAWRHSANTSSGELRHKSYTPMRLCRNRDDDDTVDMWPSYATYRTGRRKTKMHTGVYCYERPCNLTSDVLSRIR